MFITNRILAVTKQQSRHVGRVVRGGLALLSLQGALSCANSNKAPPPPPQPDPETPVTTETAPATTEDSAASSATPEPAPPQATSSETMGGASTAVSGTVQTDANAPLTLRGAPLVFAPTLSSFGLSVVLVSGTPEQLRASVRAEGSSEFTELPAPTFPTEDVAEWHVGGLAPGTHYEFEIRSSLSEQALLYRGEVTTARPAGTPFTFALISDTHVGANLEFSNQGDPTTLAAVGSELAATQPDFVVNLGDILDFHEFGFNDPPPSGSLTRAAYLNYRTLFGEPLGHMAHFAVLGGWDGENGCDSKEEVARSRDQRLLYLPGPRPDTYPQGGSSNEDYYAFDWGDALFVVLNIYSYTPTCHLLTTYPGLPDDWTLGKTQLDWLQQTLENTQAKWRFLLIHHPAGGAGGDAVNAAYGRGGGLAAHIGEQAIVHQMMIDNDVRALFYGHDHVFTDMVVDDIHYSLPGSAGAPWFFTESETGYTEFWPTSGWARVDVGPAQVHVQFIAQGGELLHEYTLE